MYSLPAFFSQAHRVGIPAKSDQKTADSAFLVAPDGIRSAFEAAAKSVLKPVAVESRLGFSIVLKREFDMSRIPMSRAEEEARLRRERLDLSIAEMGLSVRTTNCLEETGILTVRDLLNATPKRLLSISNFGEKTLEEVYAALEQLGFYRPSRESAGV